MAATVEVRFTVNGEQVCLEVAPTTPAAEVLRDRLDLHGTKVGCGEGECGACTILVNGEAVNSCLLPAAHLEGCRVETIEGLAAADGTLHPVQAAFVEAGAIQCGFCTSGMIMRTVAFLRDHARPGDEEIARSIEGNLCRCTGYVKILEAIRAAATGDEP